MSRFISDLLLKGQNVHVKGQQGSYQVTRALKKSVFRASILETNTPCVYFQCHFISNQLDLTSGKRPCQDGGPSSIVPTRKGHL